MLVHCLPLRHMWLPRGDPIAAMEDVRVAVRGESVPAHSQRLVGSVNLAHPGTDGSSHGGERECQCTNG